MLSLSDNNQSGVIEVFNSISIHQGIEKKRLRAISKEGIYQESVSKENIFKLSKGAKIRNRYNLVPHLTQDIVWESDKNTRRYHIQESQ